MKLPGLTDSDKTDRVTGGEGIVHEHSFEVGDTVIVFNNIGTLSINDGSRKLAPVVFGVIILILGLLIAYNLSGGLGVIFILFGLGLVAFGLLRPIDIFLSIGTCDGRRTNIVSKERDFLLAIRSTLRAKIDANSLATGVINITAQEISGSIAVGQQATAMGSQSKFFKSTPDGKNDLS